MAIKSCLGLIYFISFVKLLLANFQISGKLIISNQCTSTSSEVCLKWNVRLDAYDLIASTHVQYSKENADDADFKRDSVGKKQDGHCVKKLGISGSLFYVSFQV